MLRVFTTFTIGSFIKSVKKARLPPDKEKFIVFKEDPKNRVRTMKNRQTVIPSRDKAFSIAFNFLFISSNSCSK